MPTTTAGSPLIPLEAARAALHHLGDTGLGKDPGSFGVRLFVLLEAADEVNLDKLAAIYPTAVAAFRMGRKPHGVETLRAIVKAAVR